ncbi:glycosyltransferase [Nostoc sp. 'Peltigera membranacea cyanobiont' N6]|uniref:glycosyltransferase n=1 Tax=Nostoc sp. 'Peltigera membranacea cyanobiont' N6 TaxID=1261031 RepID=UPI00280B39E8|nr:glycosyltransferase [Nostoc sp. 'Peltigera membranacea cyanobiont' N6]
MKKHLSQSLPIAPSRKLKITILTVGSRGDLQPYCALAIGLKRAGHEVTVATHENFELFVRKFDLNLHSALQLVVSVNYVERKSKIIIWTPK